MPEVGIGFFPDVGATYELARAPHRLGACLAVTGLNADAADMRALGLATHFAPRAELAALEAALAEDDVEDVLAAAARRACGPSRMMAAGAEIEAAFAAPERDEVMAALSRSPSTLAAQALQAMREKSPTSQAIALRQIASARGMTLDAVLRQDFRVVSRVGVGEEFLEGVRAAVIDKDRAPRWRPLDANAVECGVRAAWRARTDPAQWRAMRHVMRQNRDGEITIVDLKPGEPLNGAAILRAWRWTTALLWFMRTISVVWLAKGMLNWAVLLGAAPNFVQLAGLPRPMQATAVFLAAADIVAAVGLWLASPWGGIVWLATAAVEMSALMFGFALNADWLLIAGIDLVLGLAYFFLLWQASGERG